MGRSRSVSRKLLLGGLSLAAVAIGIAILLQSAPVRKLILEQAKRYAANEGVILDARSLDLDLIRAAVSIDEPSVRVPDTQTFLRARLLSLRLHWSALVRGSIRIASARVEGAAVRVATDEAGVQALVRSLSSRTQSSGAPAMPDDVEILGDSIVWEDRRRGLAVGAGAWKFALEGGVAHFETAAGSVTSPRFSSPLGRLVLNGRLLSSGIAFERIEFELKGLRLQAHGSLQDFSAPRIDIQAETEVEPGRLVTAHQIRGALKTITHLEGPLDNIRVETEVHGRNLEFGDLRRISVDGRASWTPSDEHLNLHELDLSSPDGRVRLSGKVAAQSAELSTLTATFQGLGISRLMRLRQSPLLLGSRGNGQITASWPGLRVEEASVKGELSLQETAHIPSRGVLPVSGSVSFSANPKSGRFSLHDVSAMGGSCSGEVELGFENFEVSGQLRVSAGELSRTISDAALLAGSDTAATVPFRGPVRVVADLGGTLSNPRFDYRLSSSSLAIDRQDLGSLQAEGSFANARLGVARATLTRSGQSVTMEGYADLSGTAPSFELRGSGKQVDLAQLVPEASIAGAVNLEVVMRGDVRRPSGSADFSVSKLAVRAEPAGDLDGHATLDWPSVKMDQLRLRKPNPDGSVSELNASGSLDITTRSYTIQAALQGITLRRESMEIRLGGRLEGHGTISGQSPFDAKAEVLANAIGPSSTKIQLSGGLQASGDLTDLRAARATVGISELNVRAGDTEIRNEGELKLSYGDNRIEIQPTALRLGESKVELAGSLPLDVAAPDSALRLSGELPLAVLRAILPEGSLTSVTGVLNLEGAIRGTVRTPEPVLDIDLADATLEFPSLQGPLSRVTARGGLRDGEFLLNDLRGEWAGAQIEAKGKVPLKNPSSGPASEAGLQLAVKGLSLEKTGVLPKGVEGVLSLVAQIRAPGLRADSINGEIEVQELRGSYGGFEVRQRQNARLTLGRGKVRIQNLELAGPRTAVAITGDAGFGGTAELNLSATGTADAGLLSSFLGSSITAGGETRLAVSVRGPAHAPVVSGALDLPEGTASLRRPALRADSVKIGVDLSPGKLNLRELSGNLNGGTFSGSGSLSYGPVGLGDTEIQISARGLFLEFPAGTRTLSDADVFIRGADLLQVGGEVRIKGGSYTRDILTDELASFLTSSSVAPSALPQAPHPLLSRVRYDLAIRTAEPLLIDNNFGRVGAEADLKLTGSYYRPGLTGRIALHSGGILQFGGNRYTIERGSVDFVSTSGIRPMFDIQARTRVQSTEIDANIRGGGAEKLSIGLVSPTDPDLAQPDLLSLLLTGRTREELRGRENTALAHQSLLLLTGGLAGGLSGNMRRRLGTSVRLEPNLVTAESDPSSRLTIQQDFTSRLSLLYSLNLADSTDAIWIVQYGLGRFSARAIRQTDNTTRAELSHSTSFGGPPRPEAPRRETPRISSVRITGTPGLPVQRLEGALKLRTGKRLSFVDVRKDEERLLAALAKLGYLEAKVRASQEQSAGSTSLTFQVEAGPVVALSCEGFTVPGRVLKRLRRDWQSGTFEAQRLDDARTGLLGFLTDRGFLQAKVTHSVGRQESGEKNVRLIIDAGPRFEDIVLAFTGNRGLTGNELERALHDADLRRQVYSDPEPVCEYLTGVYQTAGYLDAKVGPIRYELDTGRSAARVLVPVDEGPIYRVREVLFKGNQVAAEKALREAIGFREEQVYHPNFARFALSRIEEWYWDLAYQDAVVDFVMARDSESGTVRLEFNIQENRQSVVQGIQVSGNDLASESLIRSQVGLKPGDPLRASQLTMARTNLYNTGSFSLVDFETRPLEVGTASGPKPVEMQLRVKEVLPFEFRYGALYDTSRGFGGIADFVTRKLVGNARSLGTRLRYDGETREARVYLTQPFLRRLPLQGTLLGFVQDEKRGEFTTSRFGVSAQQQTWWSNKRYTLSLGIRYEWARSDSAIKALRDSIPSRERERIAPITSSFARDTRDEILDANRGSFLSTAFEYAPKLLGSGEEYMRGFAQYSRYIPLRVPSAQPWGGDPPRPRLVYAFAGRAGSAWGLRGSHVPFSQRFFAGGGTSIRGFKQDSVGPLAPTGEAVGGDALFLLNNEIRVPLVSWLDGVSFLDAGNVYAKARDFDPFDLRSAAGVGLRLRLPYILLRLDYGFKLDRRPGEPTGAFFFSIGQSF